MERSLGPLSWHLEEPRVGQSYPNYYAAELASKHVKVVLSEVEGMNYLAVIHGDTIEELHQKASRIILIIIIFTGKDLNTEIKKIFSPISDETKNVWTRDIFKNVFRNIDAPPKSRKILSITLFILRLKLSYTDYS